MTEQTEMFQPSLGRGGWSETAFNTGHSKVYLRKDAAETSREAATKLAPRVGTVKRKVYDAIVARGKAGVIDDELPLFTSLDINTARPRRINLTADGLVVNAGYKRPNLRGNPCEVWVAREFYVPDDAA